nr:hypothetical protein [Tanacetum cinerariifolium]
MPKNGYKPPRQRHQNLIAGFPPFLLWQDKSYGFVWRSGVGECRSGVVAGKMAEKGGKWGSMFWRETLCLAQCFEKLVRQGYQRFSTSKPNNYSDDYSLTTLRAMFERPAGQDQVWKSQRSVHGQEKVKNWKLLESCGVHIISFTTTQLILLVERRYPLSRFTLDQMLNAVRLQMEEQSEMSLELLRFTRQQLQEGQHE